MKMGMEYFGDRLKALRKEKGLTQQQLADKIELVKGSISAYEQNSKYPSLNVLIKLCTFFHVSADYLLGLSDDMQFKMSALTDEQTQLILQLITELEQYNNLKDNI
jgi:transcriptional regulator with XRE-family HTH domain